jgi:sec-independent protein translocase protein TatC
MSTGDIDDSSAPLVEHLIELRNRIVKALIAFVIAVILAYLVWKPIFDFLTQPICAAMIQNGQECQLIMVKLQEGFFTAIRISVMAGFMLAFPYIAAQVWMFIAPGLYKSEKNAFLPFLLASPIMFVFGAAVAFYFVIPYAYIFFLQFQQGAAATGSVAQVAGTPGVTYQGSVAEYLSLTMQFIIAFGLCFQMPVLLTLMGRAGLISAAALVAGRRYAILIIVVLAALVTPPDMMSQLILFAAVYPLYEISILLVRRMERTKEAALRAEGLWFEDDADEAKDGKA